MVKKAWSVLLSCFVAALSGCKEQATGLASKPTDTLPLILSVPTDTASDFSIYCSNEYFDLTDSLVYSLKLLHGAGKAIRLRLARIYFGNPRNADTFYFPFTSQDTILWIHLPPYHQGYSPGMLSMNGMEWSAFARLPRSGWALLPFPVGDTSGMLRLGELAPRSRDASKGRFYLSLRQDGECFYVVDVHSIRLRTIAFISGESIDYSEPYLLVSTGYKGRPYESDVSYEQSELLVIDMRDLSIALRVPFMWGDYDHPEEYACITADRKLLCVTGGWGWSNTAYYLPGLNFLISWECLDGVAFEPSMYLEYLSDLHPLFRSYVAGTMEVISWRLGSGDSLRDTALIPWNALYYDPCNFPGTGGKPLFVSSTSDWGADWIYDHFAKVPAVSDLEGPPLELAWLRRLLIPEPGWRWAVTWDLSFERRWLIVNAFQEKGEINEPSYQRKGRKTILVPTSHLSYPGCSHRLPDLVQLPPDLLEVLPWDFLPGEEWVLVSSFDSGSSSGQYYMLYHIPSEKLVSFTGPNERFCADVIFSPDGRYVGYLCEIEGKQDSFLQVRRLPD
ncbi:hypothetical protein JXM67_02640 [candidate division WOR-3 bacterium]|nr:hypothetical protein [candidate division WOR-3 bacterium]